MHVEKVPINQEDPQVLQDPQDPLEEALQVEVLAEAQEQPQDPQAAAAQINIQVALNMQDNTTAKGQWSVEEDCQHNAVNHALLKLKVLDLAHLHAKTNMVTANR